MTRELSNSIALHARQLETEAPWIWLFDFQVPPVLDGDPPRRWRVTNSRQRVPFGQDSAGNQIYFDPMPIAHSGIEETLEADLPALTLQVANPDLQFASILCQYKGLSGAKCAVRLVNGDALDDYGSQVEVELRIIEASMDERVVSVKVGGGPLFLLSIPQEVYSRYHCPPQRVPYGGVLCGYDLSNPALAAAHPTCSRIEDGDRGCTAHGDAEVAAGLPRLHPERFGARRSIPRTKKA